MFESLTDVAVIDAIGEATRDESAAIARRFAAIGELDTRRARELAERNWWRTDPYEAGDCRDRRPRRTSAGAGRRIRCTMRGSCGIGYRSWPACSRRGPSMCGMVLTIIARTDNVEDELIPGLDAALARNCIKWMRLSGPKLTDRVDLWVTKFDPAAVRVPPKVDDNRYVEVGETSPGTAGIWANIRCPRMRRHSTRGSMCWPPACVRPILGQRSSAARMVRGIGAGVRSGWRASAAPRIARWRPSERPSAMWGFYVLAEGYPRRQQRPSRLSARVRDPALPSQCASSPTTATLKPLGFHPAAPEAGIGLRRCWRSLCGGGI